MRWLKFWFLGLLLLLLIVAVPLARQLTQAHTGTIEGSIRDEKGAPVANATIEARNILRGNTAKATSGEDGSYRVPDLVPGKYSLWVTANGHTCEWIPMVIVNEDGVTHQNLVLNCEPGSKGAPPTSSHLTYSFSRRLEL